ncbi:hypothetical protein Taro_011516 [Colocasia esculenta]|uniref:non-specific serine/threonine protein kinase n=1 Tax=Colocasia esculenta TaxID=4460 RepID=A0A843UAD1_COLES|nr:hypothetical protein [Colocasia esculenta]
MCACGHAFRLSSEITKYCFEHAPEGCMVIAIERQGVRQQDSDPDSPNYEGSHRLSSSWIERDARTGKANSPLRKLFGTRKKRAGSFDKTCSASEGKASPRTVLDGPEEGADHTTEDRSIPSGNEADRSRHRRRSSVVKRLLSFLHSAASDGLGVEGCSPTREMYMVNPSWRCFSYEEISHATDNFHPGNMVGRGGYAEVYKGTLDGGHVIAVKRLAKGGADMHKEREFLAELGILGHVCHPNTAYLVGYCIENGLHLIFDFSPNGSLASALHGRNSKVLEWPVRYKIATGIAKGLHYLHKCCRRRIIHRDIKASNILLGEDFEPQISDFGLARWLPKQWNHLSIVPIEGTFGFLALVFQATMIILQEVQVSESAYIYLNRYLAPEYFMHGIVDEKTDVFAFGVLLLELITGRRPVDSYKQSLIQWAKPLIQSGNLAELVDPELENKSDLEQVEKLVLTASYCIRKSTIWRPSMNEVLQLLTEGHNSRVAESWRMPESRSDELDDYTSDLDDHSSL